MAGIAAGGSRRSALAPYLLLAPGILYLLAFYLVPALSLARTALSPETGPWYGGLQHALSDYGMHLVRSFQYALTATVLAALLGYPLAYAMAFRAGRLKNLLLGLVMLPFFTTFLVRTLAWKTLLADEGLIVRALGALHLLPVEGRLLNTVWGVLGGLTYNFLPFMILPIYVSLEKIDRRHLEAAQDLYGAPASVFRKVVLPLSLPGLLAGSLLTFIPAAGDFVNAELLGTPNQKMLGSVIYGQFLTVRDYPLAASLSLLLMFFILLLVLAYTRALGTEDLA
ncbi:MAG: ABC transporter permease [Planctomycetes bacterium]|nr:ABC transporter permease [Planctomycetota bacterium]